MSAEGAGCVLYILHLVSFLSFLTTFRRLCGKVSLSSLNRHAVATREDVGIPKAICLKKHFSSIFPECHVDVKVMLYDASSEEEILSGHPDFVLDCIDNIDTKVLYLFTCSTLLAHFLWAAIIIVVNGL